jgi:hypothetical protein
MFSIAYCAGIGAATLGMLRAHNPYPTGTDDYAMWDRGWAGFGVMGVRSRGVEYDDV